MKKAITILLLAVFAIFALLTLTACSAGQNSSYAVNGGAVISDKSDSSSSSAQNSANSQTSSDTPNTGKSDISEPENIPEQGETPANEGGKILVAYFSCTGTTEGIANKIAAELGADACKIEPAQSYSDADLNYNDSSSRSTKEQNDPDCRPEISGSFADIQDYDTVFIGYPIWWGQAPKIVYTFIEGYDLSGKTIVPFCTSASSGVGSSAANLQKSASSANWLDGTRLTSGSDISDWINGLGI